MSGTMKMILIWFSIFMLFLFLIQFKVIHIVHAIIWFPISIMSITLLIAVAKIWGWTKIIIKKVKNIESKIEHIENMIEKQIK